jgi:hypothetical protein
MESLLIFFNKSSAAHLVRGRTAGAAAQRRGRHPADVVRQRARRALAGGLHVKHKNHSALKSAAKTNDREHIRFRMVAI